MANDALGWGRSRAMFGLFLKTAKPRHVAYGAIVMFVAAGATHWAGIFPEGEPAEEILTASIAPAAPAPVVVPLPVPKPNIAATPSQRQAETAKGTTAKREFVTRDNRDMGGGDYAVLQRVSLGVCETRCFLDRHCVAYTFNKWEGACFLKSSLSDLRLEPRGVSGVLASARVREDPRPPIIQKVPSRRLDGDAYKQVQASFGGCAQACLADDKCAGFNLPAGSQSCSLLASVDKSVAASGTASGLKMQLARRMASRERRPPWPPADMPPEFAVLFDAMIGQAMR
jgi:hypothetical protein